MTAIAAEHKAAKAACDPMAANAKDICLAQAKGAEKVAMAELTASYQPTTKARYDVRVARADADYAGNAKDVCVKEAKAVQTTAKADAKTTAGKEIAVARQYASAEKRDADYAVAKEKCDALSGAAKDACIGSAKANFGKS